MNNTKKIRVICLLIGILFILLFGLTRLFYLQPIESTQESANSADTISETDSGQPYIKVAGHKIFLWQQDNQYYAFLPSACKNADVEPEIPEGIDVNSIQWMYSENIPAVFIDTKSGTTDRINSDKNNAETGKIMVMETNGSISFYQTLEYIKGRGNTSYTEFEKKPYLIKLSESAQFLGIDSGKKWVFTANSPDSTLLRNALSRNLAGHLGIAQSDEGVFVDLYLNGEYTGNYYVTEKVEIKQNRLNITDLEEATENANENADLSAYETAWTDKTKAKQIPNDPEDITGGYLIERDFKARFLKEVETNGSYFITQAEECFIIESPEYASQNQISYINNFIQSVENAILSPDGIDGVSGKAYDELIDTDSFVRKYLLEEVTANYDGGVASSYFYKDVDTVSDKLYAGPIWDYDVSWGNSPAYLGYISTSPNRLTKLAAHSDSSAWFSALYEKPDVYKKIISCYQNEVSSYLQILAEQVLPQLAEKTAASAEMDKIRWQQQYISNGTDTNRETSITFLSDYILARKAFLDKVWIEEIPLHQVTLLLDGVVYDTLYVFDGETLPDFPEVEIDYAQFTGWISSETGEMPDMMSPIYADMTFQAILE